MEALLAGDLVMAKCSARIREMLTDQFVRSAFVKYFECQNWEELKKKYPKAAAASFINSCVRQVTPAAQGKHFLPKSVITRLNDIKEARMQEFNRIQVVCVLLFFVFVVVKFIFKNKMNSKIFS